MEKNVKRDIILGIFIVIGVTLFGVAIYYIASEQQIFGKSVSVTALFKNVGGLQPGNNVRFSGIKVGTVEKIEIASDSMARATLRIGEDARKFIKKDAFATIESDGLMGNKIVSISAGSPDAEVLENGDQIRTKEPLNLDDVISSFKETSDNTRKLTGNLNAISQQVRTAEGLLGKLVSDSILAHRISNIVASMEETGKNAAEITRQIELTARDLNRGDGLMARAIHDDQLGQSVKMTLDSVKIASRDLAIASRNLKSFAEQLNANKGIIDRLMNDSIAAKNLAEALYNVRKGTVDLDQVMTTLNESWLLNLFSGESKKEKKKEKQIKRQAIDQ